MHHITLTIQGNLDKTNKHIMDDWMKFSYVNDKVKTLDVSPLQTIYVVLLSSIKW